MGMPLVSLAITTPLDYGGIQTPINTTQSNCAGGSNCLENPLQVSNFCDLLKVVLNALIIIGLPVAVVFLVLVGFQFIIAQDNAGRLGTAAKNLRNTVIGIAIFLGAWTIAEVIKATLQALGVTGFGSC